MIMNLAEKGIADAAGMEGNMVTAITRLGVAGTPSAQTTTVQCKMSREAQPPRHLEQQQ